MCHVEKETHYGESGWVGRGKGDANVGRMVRKLLGKLMMRRT